MNPLPMTLELLQVARRVVWFKEPAVALQDPIHFLAHAMNLGTVEDLVALDKAGINLSHFAEVLDHAPAGVFDERSWAYWNLRCGRSPAPPMPVRKIM